MSRIFPISDLLVGIRQQENLTFEEAMEDVYEGLKCNIIGQEAVPPGTAALLTLSKGIATVFNSQRLTEII